MTFTAIHSSLRATIARCPKLPSGRRPRVPGRIEPDLISPLQPLSMPGDNCWPLVIIFRLSDNNRAWRKMRIVLKVQLVATRSFCLSCENTCVLCCGPLGVHICLEVIWKLCSGKFTTCLGSSIDASIEPRERIGLSKSYVKASQQASDMLVTGF